MAKLEIKLQEVQGHFIANEQYSRGKNVRIFGLHEEAGENCETKVFDLVTKKLGRKLNDEDIEDAQAASQNKAMANHRAIQKSGPQNRHYETTSGAEGVGYCHC